MPAKRYLGLVGGRTKQVPAVVVSTGATNDGDLPAGDASGRLDASWMPIGFGQNSVVAIASEALAVNDQVNLYNNAGTIAARKADATVEGKEATGFVKASVANAGSATVFTSGNILTGLSGLTPGARQYLAVTAGARTETPPATAGNVVQMLGIAASATSMIFEPEEPITVA
jgi:hypothetical protein